MRKRLRRLGFGLLALLVLVLGVGCMVGPDFIAQKQAGKYEPASATPAPAPTAHTPVAERQTEPHTCGLHAMRSLYAAYDLDPDAFNLRFRLGTDAKALRVDESSTGTLHPDLYRVLQQDGFAIERLDLESPDVAARLAQHLDRDQLALALVYHGTYHWVLLDDHEQGDQLRVIDSLTVEPYARATADFLADDALSITLVEPGDQAGNTAAAHRAGVGEMLDAAQRK